MPIKQVLGQIGMKKAGLKQKDFVYGNKYVTFAIIDNQKYKSDMNQTVKKLSYELKRGNTPFEKRWLGIEDPSGKP
jgi:hypothetical protein